MWHTGIITFACILSDFIFSLIVLAALISIFNTVKIIFMKLYSSAEEVMTMYCVYKIWKLSCSYL